MSKNYLKLSLEQAGVTLIDCVHKTPKAQDFGYPYIAIPQINEGRVNLSNVRLINEQDYEKWTVKAKPEAFDIILSRRCNPGVSAVVPIDLTCALGQNLVLLRSDGKKVHKHFLQWLTKGPEWWLQVGKHLNVGAVFDSLKCADIPKFELSVPPYEVQVKITQILSSIQNKIELNRQINQTLEAMAQALFKSWFVDFDPVKAKLAAKAAGADAEGVTLAAMEALSGQNAEALRKLAHTEPERYAELKATAALFPEALVDSELGEIPAGWEVKKLSDLAILDTSSVQPNKYPERVWEHFSIPAYDNGFSPAFDLGMDIKSNKYLIKPKSILISKLNPRFYRVWLPNPLNIENSICSTEFMQFVPQNVPQSYLLYLAKSTLFKAGLMQTVTGTTGSRQRAQPKAVVKIPVIEPQGNILSKFDEIVNPMLSKDLNLLRQSQSLTELRDTLLPKLLSGEISVDDVELPNLDTQEPSHD